jgi:hypothetical protein
MNQQLKQRGPLPILYLLYALCIISTIISQNDTELSEFFISPQVFEEEQHDKMRTRKGTNPINFFLGENSRVAIERLTANAEVATVLGSTPASSDLV